MTLFLLLGIAAMLSNSLKSFTMWRCKQIQELKFTVKYIQYIK